MVEALRRVLTAQPGVAYALVFGSAARGAGRPDSDVDVAVGLSGGEPPGALQLGDLVSRLEAETGRRVDLVILDEAPSGLAYRVFREGQLIMQRDRRVLAERKARALLEHLDFQPIQEICARGVLAAAAGGR